MVKLLSSLLLLMVAHVVVVVVVIALATTLPTTPDRSERMELLPSPIQFATSSRIESIDRAKLSVLRIRGYILEIAGNIMEILLSLW